MFDFRRIAQSLRKFTGKPTRSTQQQAVNVFAGSRANYTGQLVLVVDDQRTNRTLLVRLINILGYAAEATESGAMALEKWKGGQFALMITDCHMTGVDGYALTRNIRRIESRDSLQRMPIIAWTATTLPGMDQNCAEAGMDDHLPKPVDLDTLAGMLERWLPSLNKPLSKAASDTAMPAVSNITLDRAVLTRYSSGDPLLEQEILREFRSANSADIALFEQALAQHDPLLVAQAAHRIKGASRMIGAHAFAAICERIEKNGRARNWDAITTNRELFFGELGKLNEALNSC